MKRMILSCLCIAVALATGAQTLNKKMGNPTMEEMNMTECAFDKNASAVVLYEDFNVYVVSIANSLQLEMVCKRRVKVLKEDGLDAANVTLTLRDSKIATGYHDRLHELKAYAYNLVNGKVEKTKMSNDMVSKKRMNDSFSTTEFTIPQVKVGTVIEYQYKIDRDALFDLPTWVAQCTYPVNYTHFRIALPEEFSYKVNQTGGGNLVGNRDEEANTVLGTKDVIHDFTGTNLAALPKDNEYIFCPIDFADKVTSELRGINIPGQLYKDYTTTQADVIKLLMDSDMFGGRLKQKNPYKDEMAAAGIASLPTAMEKVVASAKLLKSHLRWNKEYSLMGESQSKVTKEGTGDNADLNFILMSMLKDAGVETSTVLMSRRSRGRLPYQPSIDALNTFVIAFADESGALHFYDASAENGYVDALSVDLNVDRAILVNPSSGHFNEISLQDNIKRREQVAIKGTLSTDGVITATCSRYYRENNALRFRNSWEEKNDSAAFVAEIAADENIEISEYSTQGREDFSPSVVEEFTFTKQLEGGDKYYLAPLLLSAFEKSPFPAETSEMPVEFGAKGNVSISINIQLPEGYHVEEAPKPLSMQLPDGGLSVKMMAGENDGIINANCRLTTNQLFFAKDSYALVKQFYDELAKKCNEMLVISKQ